MSKVEINTGNTIGITRKIDELGRVVLPIEFRKQLGLKHKDPVNIYLLENGFYVEKK
mgnify:CR=1 FL=1